MIAQKTMMPPLSRVHDRLEDLRGATAGFANSDKPLLEYVMLSETAMPFSRHLLSISDILENYRCGVFNDHDFSPHGCLQGSAYSYVRKEEAATVVKSALEETFSRVFAVTNDMSEYEQIIKGELKMIAAYFYVLRDLERLQEEWLSIVKKVFPKERSDTQLTQQQVLETLQEATLMLQAKARPEGAVVDRVTMFVRLIHKYALEELEKPLKEVAGDFLSGHFKKTWNS